MSVSADFGADWWTVDGCTKFDFYFISLYKSHSEFIYADRLWTNGKIYENVVSETSDIQRPVQRALQTNDNHDESFWLKGYSCFRHCIFSL